jgi:hypothetical protein
MSLDRMFYLVVSDHHSGPIIWERQLEEMDRATVAEDLSHGQFGKIISVIEFNPVEGICRECTDDFRTIIDRSTDDA